MTAARRAPLPTSSSWRCRAVAGWEPGTSTPTIWSRPLPSSTATLDEAVRPPTMSSRRPSPPDSPLVSTSWLAARLGSPGLQVLDGSWYLPASGRDAAAEYRAGHIPGALFFDLDEHSDRGTTLPHMLPSADRFARSMSALGLSWSDTLVIYDG